MANINAAELVPDSVADRMVVLLTNKLAPLSVFTSDFSDELIDPKRPIQIPVAISGSTTLVNPTNFEQGDTETDTVPVSTDQYSQPFHITNEELQVGHKLERKVDINLKTLANKIADAAFAPLTAANFTNTPIVAATSADFDTVEVKALWASISDADEKNLVLHGDYYSELMPTNRDQFSLDGGAYGFDKVVYSNRFGNAGANVVGFASSPAALVAVSRIPEMSNAVRNNMDVSMNVELPQLGMTVQYNMWAAQGSRLTWASFDICFGVAKGDGSALTLLKTA